MGIRMLLVNFTDLVVPSFESQHKWQFKGLVFVFKSLSNTEFTSDTFLKRRI